MRKLTFALAILMLFVVGPDQTLAKPDNEPNRTEPAPAPPPQPPSSEGGVGDFSRRLRGRWGPRRGPGGPSGLSGLGGFEETVDPKSEPRRGMGDVPPEVANQPARSNNARTTVHQPTVEELRARVQELESVRYGNIPPVSSTQAAEEDVKRLRAQLEQMRSHRELVNRREARRLRSRMEEFGRRWHRAAEAMAGEPDEVSRTEWRRIATEVLIGEVPETTFVPEPKPEPKPEDEDEGWYFEPGEEPITEEDVPAAPAPKPEEIVKPEQISEAFVKLYEAIKSGKKPKNMGIKEWVVLLDEYYSDISVLHADAAATMRKLDEKRAGELAELTKALKAAEERFKRAQELEKTLDGEQMRVVNKDLAWRKHEAELAAARVHLRDAERLEKERKGEKTVRVPVGGYSGAVAGAFLDMGSKLADAFRELDVQGHGSAPPSEVLANEGLPLPG